jgi:hypothetical protein
MAGKFALIFFAPSDRHDNVVFSVFLHAQLSQRTVALGFSMLQAVPVFNYVAPKHASILISASLNHDLPVIER